MNLQICRLESTNFVYPDIALVILERIQVINNSSLVMFHLYFIQILYNECRVIHLIQMEVFPIHRMSFQKAQMNPMVI